MGPCQRKQVECTPYSTPELHGFELFRLVLRAPTALVAQLVCDVGQYRREIGCVFELVVALEANLECRLGFFKCFGFIEQKVAPNFVMHFTVFDEFSTDQQLAGVSLSGFFRF